ncbi:hypothetical protein MKW98_005352 [Papaver atlanticum]|uniref:Uncharacterized protein n=1 Tax=Papaver atlanticum TaxID=357466 RepID=A0AAD4X3Y0_9MAGN|nr:hypothetical protein MKW98_005352 [Papaver atlanticum]
MGIAKEIKMAKRSSCLNFILALLFSMAVFMSSHTANAIQCKSGEIFASTIAVVFPPCGYSCQAACPHGSTVTGTNCEYRLFKLPLCECCCKMPPKPKPPSPPPPSPPPPSPSPPPPSPPPSPPPPSHLHLHHRRHHLDAQKNVHTRWNS